ncbi:hypothetical protein [Roseovarius sp. MMSF_3281]|uniref:hypothetical protein n=1 Tax=Roseovarius sp. MMSF_3281 TaxID=3046694 RepID=UPI00273DF75B|nr:hypothetical protein [Roseovarius sp. MMSF_3281]
MSYKGRVPSDWCEPDWANAQKVHDWKNYAGERLRDVWPSLSHEAKKAISETLDDVAGREEWE